MLARFAVVVGLLAGPVDVICAQPRAISAADMAIPFPPPGVAAYNKAIDGGLNMLHSLLVESELRSEISEALNRAKSDIYAGLKKSTDQKRPLEGCLVKVTVYTNEMGRHVLGNDRQVLLIGSGMTPEDAAERAAYISNGASIVPAPPQGLLPDADKSFLLFFHRVNNSLVAEEYPGFNDPLLAEAKRRAAQHRALDNLLAEIRARENTPKYKAFAARREVEFAEERQKEVADEAARRAAATVLFKPAPATYNISPDDYDRYHNQGADPTSQGNPAEGDKLSGRGAPSETPGFPKWALRLDH